MSKPSIKETMQQALKAIEQYAAMDLDNIKPSMLLVYNLRQAIKDCEQAETQESVGEVVEHETSSGDSVCFGEIDAQLVHIGDKLYTHPKPQQNNMKVSIIIIIYTMIIAAIGLVMGVGINVEDANNKCYQQAIKHNAAEYNSTTGVFEWLK